MHEDTPVEREGKYQRVRRIVTTVLAEFRGLCSLQFHLMRAGQRYALDRERCVQILAEAGWPAACAHNPLCFVEERTVYAG
ncbi:MAG: hypothetical protein C5B51_16450 [Terriglobia bacterium]|nr:MAG: hypothetical protein C5B51_16450 [Terriglobia bacterium]